MGGQCKPATHPTSNRELELQKITVLVFVSAILTPLVQAQNLTCRLSNTETKPLETMVFVTAGPAISYANKRTAQDSYYTINFATIGFSLGKGIYILYSLSINAQTVGAYLSSVRVGRLLTA